MRRIAALVVVAASAVLVPVGGQVVSAASGTTCMVEHVPTLKPGLSAVEGSSGTFEDAQDGTITCDGPVVGVTPTGPGTLHDKGNYGTKDGDSCFGGGEGEGAYTLVLPTADGERTLLAPFTMTFGDPNTNGEGVVTVHLRGEGWSGDLGVTPTKGDCFSTPVTEVRVTGKVIFS
jgi:hypothetical protein